MISVLLEGRLGNQLFQYAFIWSAAKKLNTSFYMDQSIEPFLLPRYFNIPGGHTRGIDEKIFSISGYKNFFSFYLRRAFYKVQKQLLFLTDVEFYDFNPSTEEIKKLKSNSRYKGYFQSEAYFSPYEESIKKLFTIRPNYREAYQRIAASVTRGKKTVVIHLRRGDYESLGFILPDIYYQNALTHIQNPDNFYVIISDEPDAAEKQFSALKNKYVSRHPAIIDFQFLMNADICILANSSFSWWGAYLNTKQADILVPRFWNGSNFGHEIPSGIIPSNWIQIATHH